MSALPIVLRDAKDAGTGSPNPIGRILKIYNSSFTLDPYYDRLMSVGYEVIEASSYEDGLALSHQQQPDLIVVYDDPAAGLDALAWLHRQHNDSQGWLAATPLMILADAARMPDLRAEELPDRVVVLQRRADTLNQLTRTVRRVLKANRWD